MCNVNYVAEFEAFMRYAEDNLLSGRERLLWIALFHSANRRKSWNAQTGQYEWPDGFFVVTNDALHSNACLDKRGVADMRNSLKQRGLIDFIKGEKNKAHPQYKINYFTVGNSVGSENVPNHVPNNVPNDVPNHVPNNTPTIPPTAPQYININTDTGGNTGIGVYEKKDPDNDIQEEYYTCAGTRDFFTATDNRYLNQFPTWKVLRWREKLDLPNENWRTSTIARRATAQHVADAIARDNPYWGKNPNDTAHLFDEIQDALDAQVLTPLSIYIMGIRAGTVMDFYCELGSITYIAKRERRAAAE